jgi:hypothetical protein
MISGELVDIEHHPSYGYERDGKIVVSSHRKSGSYKHKATRKTKE